jgi:hypothetical protein
MKKILLLTVLFLLWAPSVKAVNITASGTLTTNTTWNADTVKVTGTVGVANGVTLTIAAGTYVQFQGLYAIEVGGSIVANGSSNQKIHFAPLNNSTGWKGIRFDSPVLTNDSSFFRHCVFSYGKAASGGTYDKQGGAIFFYKWSKALVQNCHFSNNYASYYGGAISCWYQSSPKLINNIFSNNTAGSMGGAVFMYSSSNPLILNSTIVNNSAGSRGGGVCAYNTNPIIYNSIIYGNTASSEAQVAKGSSINVKYSNIEGGYNGTGNIDTVPNFVSPSTGGGSAYDGLNANWALQASSACIDQGNNQYNAELSTFDIDGNYRFDADIVDMGAVEYISSTEACGTISSNTTWSGSVIVSCDVTVANGVTLTISPGTKVMFLGHYKLDIDGRLLAVGTQSDFIEFTSFNQSEGWKGIRFESTSTANDTSRIEFCKIQYGNASSTAGFDEYGGGLFVYYFSKLVVRSNFFVNNQAVGDGGAICCYQLASPKIINNVIVNNKGYRGGGIAIRNSSSPTIYNNTIANNEITYSLGSGIYRSSGSPTIKNNIIYGNTGASSQIYPTSGITVQYCDVQGGYSGTGNLSSNPKFKNPSPGSGVNYNGLLADWSLQETSPCIDGGTSSITGMGLPAYDLLGKTRFYSAAVDMGAYEDKSTLAACGTISSNTTWDANTINVTCDVTVANGVTLTILPGTKVKFSGNYELQVSGSLYAVGTETDTIRFTTDYPSTGWKGIRIDNPSNTNDSTIIHHCRVEYANYASSYSGGIYVYSFDKVRISNNLIINNSNSSGTGGGLMLRSTTADVFNNAIKNNTAKYGAGFGAYSYRGIAKNNIITGNVAERRGGGMYLLYSECTVLSNLIANNEVTYTSSSASYGGGGICFYGYYNATFINNVIVNNESAYNGGGIHVQYDSKPVFINNTISNNEAKLGGGLFAYNNADPIIKNCIMYGDSASNLLGGNEVYLYDVTCDPKFYNSVIEGGKLIFGGTGALLNFNGVFTSNIDDNPEFVGASAATGTGANGVVADWGIDSISPCINSGLSDTTGMGYIPLDYAKNNRVHRGRIDMGAYENQQDIYSECTISSNTTWEADTIKVACDVSIADGVTLTISPGTYVEFQGFYKLDVQGQLLALGTADEPIIFSVVDTTGFIDMSSSNGAWNGIDFNSTPNGNDTSKIVYCTIKYAKAYESSAYSSSGGGIMIYNYSKVLIANSIITNNQAIYYGGGIYIESSNPIIRNSIICNNSVSGYNNNGYGGGIYMDDASPTFYNNVVAYNYSVKYGGGMYFRSTNADFRNNIILKNQGYYSTTSSYNPDMHISSGSSINFYNNLLDGGKTKIVGYNSIGTFQDNLDDDPLFINPPDSMGAKYDGGGANWQIDQESPVINAGYNAIAALSSSSSDFFGNSRIVGDTVDIGHAEIQLSSRFINQNPVAQTACVGTSISFSTSIGVSADIQWQKDGVNITGATGNSYTMSSIALSDTGNYSCVFSNSFGSVNSDVVSLTVQTAPSITLHPSSEDRCLSDSVTFMVQADGTQPITYQWQNTSGNLQGSVPMAYYTVGSSNSVNSGTSFPAVYGNYYWGTRNQFLITAADLTAAGISEGDLQSLAFEVTNTNNCPALDGFTIKIGFTTASSLSSTWESGLTTVYYNASYQPTVGWNTHAFNTAVNWDGTSNLIIETCFNNSSYLQQGNASMSLVSTSYNSTHERHLDNSSVCTSTDGSLYTKRPVVKFLAGSETSNYYINAISQNDATTYKCNVSNVCGSQLSNGAVLTVKTPPSISSLPGTYSLCETNPIPLSVTATGDPTPTYQWYKDSVVMTGYTSHQLNISAASASDEGDYYCKASNVCGEDSTNISSVIVEEEPTIVSQSSSTAVCEGQSLTLSISATGAAPLTYQWYKNGSTISGASNNTYTISSVSTSDAATYVCRVTNNCAYAESNGIIISVNSSPTVVSQSSSTSVCESSAHSFTLTATGTATLSYQWYNSSGAISGATNNSYSIGSVSTTDADNYYCIVSNSCGTDQSNAIGLTVNTAPSVGTNPSNLTKCDGQSAQFTIQASGTSPISYQWYKSPGTTISGATGNSLLISPVSSSDAGSYYCIATNSCGNDQSNSASLTVNNAAEITTQSSSTTVCENTSHTMSVTATGSGSLSYQWYNSSGAISGATNNTYSLGSVSTSHADDYYCIVSNSCGSDQSNTISLGVNTSPSISNQPVSTTVCENQSAIFSISGSGTAPLSYQWYDGNGSISGATNASYLIPAVSSSDAGSYYCKITNTCGNVTSTTANLTVNTNVSISSQSASKTVCSGSSPSFAITASGTATIAYQWYKDNTAIANATNNTISLSSVDTSDVGAYYVIASNTCNSVQSNSMQLIVNEGPSITSQPVSQVVCAGNAALLSVSASGTAPLSYQWYKGGSQISGATNSSYQISSAASSDASTYYVVVSNSCGSANSSNATLAVKDPVSITYSSPDQSICSGNSASFSVTASGSSPLNYQWYYNGSAISGATSASYSINQADTSDQGDYYCMISNSCNSVQSSTRSLTIYEAPIIAQQSSGSTLCNGTNLTLSVSASGSGTLSYQWFKNSSSLSGANSSVYPIYQSTTSDAGTYHCVVTNLCGNTSSNNMVVVVNESPTIISQSSAQNICENTSTILSVSASGTAPIQYQWYGSLGLLSGAVGSSYSISNADTSDADTYYCIVSNMCDTISSGNIEVNVLESPTIITQSSGANKCEGSAFSFSVNANGTAPIAYQWYDANGMISGAVNNLYLINSVDTSHAGSYYCVVSNTCGTVNSTNKTLAVSQAPGFVSQSTSATQCEGTNMLFTVNANGSAPLNYQWYVDTGMVAGANANSYSISGIDVSNSGNYYCVVNNSCGSITSTIKTLNVNEAPTLLSQSNSDTLCEGQSMVFNVNAAGTSPISYQWFKGSSAISGAVNSLYMIASVDTLDAAVYHVVATNVCGNIQSNNISLDVNMPVQLTFQSGDSSRCEGESVQLAVQATGTSPLSYQWYKSGNVMSTQTAAQFSLNNLSSTDAGYYSCVVSNMCNSQTSSNKVITVHANPQVSLGQDTSFCLGGQVILSPGFGYNCIWNNGSFNNQITVSESGSYWVDVSDNYGCSGRSDTVSIFVAKPYAGSDICIAGVDSATQKNVVVWEKTLGAGIESYNVYRESSTTGVWTLIENKPIDSLAVVFDLTSNPIAHADRYAIAAVDTCGNESALSSPHKTMFLAVSPASPSGYNLNWNGYQGFTVASYIIWKADTSLNWTKVDSVNGNIFMWHDPDTSSTAMYYQVEVIRPGGPCNPAKANTNYNTSRSNQASNGYAAPTTLAPDFIATPTQGVAPLVVVFYDQTLGNPTSWYWNFGDGSTSTQQNPAHQYDSTGIYDVTLTCTSIDGVKSVTKFGYIDVLVDGMVELENKYEVAVFPNPYQQKTNIVFSLNSASKVRMEVYSSLGQLVDVIEDANLSAGNHSYTFSAQELGFAEGVYFLCINIDGKTMTKKLVEIK